MFENRYDHPAIPHSVGMRTDRWKYIHWQNDTGCRMNNRQSSLGEHSEELYDLHQDTHEVRNLAMLDEHQATLNQMRTLLTKVQQSYACA